MDRSACTNTNRIRRLIAESGLDAVVAIAPENVTHCSGYYNLDQRLLPENLHACVWTAEGEPTLIIPERERKLETFVRDVREHRAYGDFDEQGLDLLAEALRARGTERGRVGLDLRRMSAIHLRGLEARLPELKVDDATALFGRMRLVKAPEEIAILRRAAVATEKAIAIGYAQAAPGNTEKSVVDAMDCHLEKLGAEAVAFNVMASGERTVQGHHRAELAPIAEGDVLRVDYGGLFDGYYTDLVRMAVVGRPSDRQRTAYEKCYAVHQRCLAVLRPGITGHQIYELAVAAYAEVGLPLTRDMFGHSIGLAVHERPVFCAGDDWALEPGVVVCVENGYTDFEHKERYHVEDMLVITENGSELLSTYSDPATMNVIT
ncbi:MAG: Xaa-Pro peptidase family protein [Chloroflexi bacterium]|nr:Xaa-Pro peptidase family protein [Chloroflexota bacterium]MCL5111221.1 Xaa-Pro peptidase family protein [Chloroflexota bacterium]